ncbi:sortase domain-containing protein [Janibacter alkaliphilus]|uniref:Sortase (Surface protein transpeptidase) n=1 Tax=Janibacter alkaliphilus TaxID=1069963 RepID=A0A852X2K8_9MICO|nr:sortase (surface protein transpeptidase) [Janibacter alkaliphilus]
MDAPVEPEAVDAEGVLGVPSDPQTLGWWAEGPLPGSDEGTAIIAGHIEYQGEDGAFAELDSMDVGDRVTVVDDGRRDDFEVAVLRTWDKSSLAEQDAFAADVPGRVALVSCTGDIDPETGVYEDNVVVYAVPA